MRGIFAHGRPLAIVPPAGGGGSGLIGAPPRLIHDREERAMEHEERDRGSFAEGEEELPREEHVGSFAEGEETEPQDEHVGSFAEGEETLPEDDHEGSFAEGQEEED
jgi:hypothetical protein